VKESLFNIIASDVPGARVLDLFAGSGALGIEALSRGAASACFVERSRPAAAVLQSNLERTRFEDRARLVVADVYRALSRLAREGASFDLVFVDPPYEREEGARCVAQLSALNLLAPGGLVVVEHRREEDMPVVIENLTKIRSVRYGRTALSFFRAKDADDGQGGGD